jgi:hypothetical protein
MRRALPALLLVPLAACAPHGLLRTERGSDRIRTALHFETEIYGSSATAVVLSNSHFPCALPSQPDPDAILAAEQQYHLAWNREGTMVVSFLLYSWDEEDWSGRYPVSEVASPFGLDELEPRAAMASFRAVWEAEVSEEDGLYREYQPVLEEWTMPVEAPGEVEIVALEDRLEGSFGLDTLDVSGRFTTTACEDGGDLMSYLGSYSGLGPGDTREGEDTTLVRGEPSPEGALP